MPSRAALHAGSAPYIGAGGGALPPFNDSPDDIVRRHKRSFIFIGTTFVALLLVSIAASWAGIEVVNATRAYATGEGRYSKAQKIAVLNLHRYAESGSAADYRAFLQAIDVPRGDRDARLQLEAAVPDIAVLRDGLLRGQNHPDDHWGLITLFRLFDWWGPFAAAVADWRTGDALVAELLSAGQDLHALVQSGAGHGARMATLTRIDEIDHRLTRLEDNFSTRMGEAARAAKNLVVFGLGGTTFILWAVGMAFATRLLRRQLAADRRLARSERRFRDYADVASDWYWETDAGHNIRFLSERFFETTEYGPSDILDRSGIRFMEDHVAEGPSDERLAAFRERRPFRGLQIRLARPGGEPGFWALAGKPCFDADGTFQGFRGVGTDVTGQIMDSRSLRLEKERAEIANRAKSEFLANMSHELRTPLNAILGFAEVIREQMFGSGAARRYADYAGDIHSSGSHLLSIIDDILDLSKIEAGHSDLEEAEISLADLFARTRTLLGDRAERAGLNLVTEIETPSLRLRVDERKFKQALLNLLTNALKFTPKGGTVVLSVLDDPGRDFGISVRDTGIGIAEKDFDVILAPFGQVESAYRRQHPGTGLGLPLANALIEQHGGRLTLQSAVGIGTTVTLWLPRWRILSGRSASRDDNGQTGQVIALPRR
ncbi:ATP-binding protein [Marinibaculum pumilum]|uniref:histidine kinase n=1 Tax=Marinibaculum pumilum TaxID=1766165 RepID=A0ABV7L348_9PROT